MTEMRACRLHAAQNLALLLGLIGICCGSERLLAQVSDSSPESGAAQTLSLCDALARIGPGEKLEVTVSGVYEESFEVAVLYDPDQRRCEYDVQPSTYVDFSERSTIDESLRRVLKTAHRAQVTFQGTLWGPPPVPEDNPEESSWVAGVRRVINRRGYGHLHWSRTKLEVEKVVDWRKVPPEASNWGTGAKVRPISPIPVVASAAVPRYPPDGLVAGLAGEVIVEVGVKDGRVVETRVQSGDRLLVPAVLENIATWTFKADVNTAFTTTFKFELELRKTGADPNLRIELNLPTSAKIVAPLRAN